MLLRLCLSSLLRLGVLLRPRMSSLLRLSMLLRLCLSSLLRLSMLLRLCLSSLLRLSMLLRLCLSSLLRLGVLLRLCLSSLLRLGVLLRLCLSSLLRLGVLLRLRLSSLLLRLRLSSLLLRRPLLRSGASRNYGSNRPADCNGLRLRKNGRASVIDRSKLLMVLRSRLLMLHLRRHGRNALSPQGGAFGRHRPASDAARSVVAGTIDVGVVDGPVIDANVGDVYVVDGTIVVEPISAPITTLVARAGVSVAVVNTSVVADILAPGSVVVAVHPCHESPISGGPQEPI